MLMRTFFLLFLFLLSPSTILASENCEKVLVKFERSFFVARGGHSIYYEFHRASDPHAETVVISNGLHYEIKNYKKLIKELKRKNVNVLVYAHRSQHESLEESKKRGIQEVRDFTLVDLAKDLSELVNSLQIDRPIHLVGLSFGASVATVFAKKFSNRVASVSYLAPLVRLAPEFVQARQLRKFWSPFWMASSGLQEYSIEIEAMLDAIEKFDLKDAKVRHPVLMVLAEKEDGYLKAQQQKVVEDWITGKRDLRAVEILGGEHSLPTSSPKELAEILIDFIKNLKLERATDKS